MEWTGHELLEISFKMFTVFLQKNIFINILIALFFSFFFKNLALRNQLDSWLKNNCSFEVSRHCNDN